MNKKYTYAYSQSIYEEFRKAYTRATDAVLSIYRISPKYAIDLIINKKFRNWYQFKAIVKMIDKEFKYPPIAKEHEETMYPVFRAKIKKRYAKVETR